MSNDEQWEFCDILVMYGTVGSGGSTKVTFHNSSASGRKTSARYDSSLEASKQLEQLGSEGWEMFATEHTTEWHKYWLKRRLA